MELIVIAVVVIVVLVAAGASPMVRRQGDAAEKEMHAVAPGADVGRQFKRPRNDGDLF
jgi:hypothetical protein